MQTQKQLNAQIQSLEVLRAVADAFAEISSNRMKKVRENVVDSRDFLIALNDIFTDVSYHYRKKVMELAKTRKVGEIEKLTFLSHNGKTVAVFLSANTGLYGELVQTTFAQFLEEVRQKNAEATIVGKLGLSLFLQAEPTRPYSYFDLSDDKLDPKALALLIEHLVQYEEIHIYHGRFKNLVTQEPAMLNISAETPVPDIFQAQERPVENLYIFEPSVEKILVFFEEEIFGAIFAQTVHENQLAKYASRMLAMDKAVENVTKSLKDMQLAKKKLSHYLIGKKQQDGLAVRMMIQYE